MAATVCPTLPNPTKYPKALDRSSTSTQVENICTTAGNPTPSAIPNKIRDIIKVGTE